MPGIGGLYTGALLGQALSKQLGISAAYGSSIGTAERKAYLETGIASGKINPASLSASDAGLLPSIPKGPSEGAKGVFGFLHNLGSDIASTTESLPEGIYKLGKDLVESEISGKGQGLGPGLFPWEKANKQSPITQDVRGMARGTLEGFKEFTEPSKFYQHPLNPLLNLAAVGSLGLGSVARGAAAISRGTAGTESTLGEAAAGVTRALGTEGRASIPISPGLTGVEKQVLPATVSPPYSLQPLTRLAQKGLIDPTLNVLKSVPMPFSGGRNLADIRGTYLGRKLIGRTRGQMAAGVGEEFGRMPQMQDFLHSVHKMYKNGPGFGQMKFEAMMLMNSGIHDLPMLDEYATQLARGEDVTGQIMTPEMQQAANDRIRLYQQPEFRELIEKPTMDMKVAAYHYRRVILADMSKGLPISPQTFETNTYGRLRELTGKSPEELRAELPPELQADNTFAKNLFTLQTALEGRGTAEIMPTVEQLSREMPFGNPADKVRLIKNAIQSYRRDLSGESPLKSMRTEPGYIPGNNLFEKIAAGMPELGIDTEQAQAFARGVPLGEEGGPIMPTYVPSVSGQGMNYGIQEGRTAAITRKLGGGALSRERMPQFYEYRKPFNPKTASARTIGLGPMANYLKEASYEPFLSGTMRLDPEMILQHVYQVNKDLVSRKLEPQLLQKLAIKDETGAPRWFTGEGEMLEALGNKAQLYNFVPTATWRNYFISQTEMGTESAELMRSGATGEDLVKKLEEIGEESAQKFVREETDNAGLGRYQGLAIPKTFTDTLIRHTRMLEHGTGLAGGWATLVARWKAAVLSYMPAWLMRTTIGHGIIALISGTLKPNSWFFAHKYFEDRPVLPGQLNAVEWGKRYGDQITLRALPQQMPYGINQGSLMHELSDVGQGAREANLKLWPRMITKGVHYATNYQRRAIFLHQLEKMAKNRLGELRKDFEHPGGFWNAKNIDAVLDPEWRAQVLQQPDLIEHAFDQVSKASYTFGQMNPWERQLVKYGMPFWGWYKFITKFVWSLPFDYPGRSVAIAQLGQLGARTKEGLGPIPDYLSGAVFFDAHNPEQAKYLNLYGLNPFYDFANPIGPEGAVAGLAKASQFSPIIQAIASAYGFNPLSGDQEPIDPRSGYETDRFGKIIDLKTGQEVAPWQVNAPQRLLGTFMRAFPEIRLAELAATKGNPVYPESIPFISEHPKPVEPSKRHGANLLEGIGQEFGISPRSVNLAKYQADLLKSVLEARRSNIKRVAKAELRLAEK